MLVVVKLVNTVGALLWPPGRPLEQLPCAASPIVKQYFARPPSDAPTDLRAQSATQRCIPRAVLAQCLPSDSSTRQRTRYLHAAMSTRVARRLLFRGQRPPLPREFSGREFGIGKSTLLSRYCKPSAAYCQGASLGTSRPRSLVL